MTSLRAILAGVAVTGLAVGCSSAPAKNGPPENTSAPVDALDDPSHPGIEKCRAGDVTDNLELAADFKQSCHEMVVCGGLNASMTTTLISVMISAATGSGSSPNGFVFDGKGTWSAGTQMDVQFMLGFDTSFGKAGDVVTFDPFQVSNYFTGYTITAKASINTSGKTTQTLTMVFTGLGPGIELLGLGAKPVSPIVIDSDKIGASLGKLQLASKIHVDNTQGHGHIKYELVGPPTTLASINSGDAMPMKLTSVSGTRDDTGQTLAVTAFDIAYKDIGAGYLDGSIGFDITGGKGFPYHSVFTYPHRSAPDVSLACK